MERLTLPTRILVRTNVDYATMDLAAFGRQSDPSRPLPHIVAAANSGSVQVFNDVFGVDFFAFRGRLKALAEPRLRAIPDAQVTIGFDDFDDWFRDPRDEMIYPIDDDDVFDTRLPRLSSIQPATTLVVWEHVAVGFPLTGVHPALHRFRTPVLFSNNWGVRKSFLQAAMSKKEALEFLADHGTAQTRYAAALGLQSNEWAGAFGAFFAELRAPAVEFVEGHFGVQLYHPASLMQLAVGAQIDDIGGRLRRLDLETRTELPEELAWARSFVREYEDLVGTLAATRHARSA